MTAWLSTLPQNVNMNGYQEEPVDNTIRSSMSYGPDKIRRRTTSVIFNCVMPMVLTTAQTALLDTFYYTTLEQVGTFTWKNHRTQAAATYRFRSPPVYQTLGKGLWSTALQLELLP